MFDKVIEILYLDAMKWNKASLFMIFVFNAFDRNY